MPSKIVPERVDGESAGGGVTFMPSKIVASGDGMMTSGEMDGDPRLDRLDGGVTAGELMRDDMAGWGSDSFLLSGNNPARLPRAEAARTHDQVNAFTL